MTITAFTEMMRNESGQGLVEYSLVLGFVSIAAILSLQALGHTLASNGRLSLNSSANVIP